MIRLLNIKKIIAPLKNYSAYAETCIDCALNVLLCYRVTIVRSF